MILDLDQSESLDATRVGSKAARLARARQAGLPVLPGIVVSGEASQHHMRLGAETIPSRGSGGARLVVSGEPIAFGKELISAGSELGDHLVARSSTSLEGTGEWAGAFTSYLELEPSDLPRAVAGCWAAAFSVAALERQDAAGIEPGSFLMPVLIQPALQPVCGGAAELMPDGTVVAYGVKGPPGPLLQGWVSGEMARSSDSEPNGWAGAEMIQIVGVENLDLIAGALRRAQQLLGLNRCEWAVDGGLWILQLDVIAAPTPTQAVAHISGSDVPDLVRIAQTAMRAPGKLGEELVMPWALMGIPVTGAPEAVEADDALGEAQRISAELTSQVWGLPLASATESARGWISALLGSEPSDALEQLPSLSAPDPQRAALLMSLLTAVRAECARLGVVASPDSAWHLSTAEIQEGRRARPGFRVGLGRWEPFVASVVLAAGEPHRAVPASPGIGAGVQLTVGASTDLDSFRPRSAIVSGETLPRLASLLWDSACLVTDAGSPAAHLFESARSLGVPAVCGLGLEETDDQIVAVDGYSGLVSTIPLYESI